MAFFVVESNLMHGQKLCQIRGSLQTCNNEVEVVNRLKRFPKQVRMKTLKLLASFLGHEL